MLALSSQNSELVSTLGRICNCCTTLGKSLSVGLPVTLTKECSLGLSSLKMRKDNSLHFMSYFQKLKMQPDLLMVKQC